MTDLTHPPQERGTKPESVYGELREETVKTLRDHLGRYLVIPLIDRELDDLKERRGPQLYSSLFIAFRAHV